MIPIEGCDPKIQSASLDQPSSRFFIANAFSVPGCSTVAVGRVERCVATKSCNVETLGLGANFKSTPTDVEVFYQEFDRGEAGENTGALLRGLNREGMVMAAPGSMKSVSKFRAQIYVN